MSARDSEHFGLGGSCSEVEPPPAVTTLLPVHGAPCQRFGRIIVCGEHVSFGSPTMGPAGGLHCRSLDCKAPRAVLVPHGMLSSSDAKNPERFAAALDCAPESARAAISHVTGLASSKSSRCCSSPTLHLATGAVLKHVLLAGVAALAYALLHTLVFLTLHHWAVTADIATAALEWLVHWPAGVKLNGPVTRAAGRSFHLFLQAQDLIISIVHSHGGVLSSPPQPWAVAAGAGALLLCPDRGLASAPVVLARLATAAHGPLLAGNALLARSLAALLSFIRTTIRAFRGHKANPLRQRVDSAAMEPPLMLVATVGLMVACSIATAIWPFHALALLLALPGRCSAAAARALTQAGRRVAGAGGSDGVRACAGLWAAEVQSVALVPSRQCSKASEPHGPRAFHLAVRRQRGLWSAAGASVACILAALQQGLTILLTELVAGRPGPAEAAGLQHWSVSRATLPRPHVGSSER